MARQRVSKATRSANDQKQRDSALSWQGTQFEEHLRCIRIDASRSTMFPATEAGHIQLWNWIYAMLQRFGQRHEESPAKASLSKDAARRHRLAKELASLAADVEQYFPPLAKRMRSASSVFDFDSKELLKLARGQKRHRRRPETASILEIMCVIYHESGRWHDSQVSVLLELAGMHQYSPEALRVLRTRYELKSNCS